MTQPTHDRIAVVDFGGQYAHLIATKVRRQHVLSEILQPDDPVEKFAGFKGIILSGSPSLASSGEGGFNRAILDLDVPILGFCFGHQEIAKHYGGAVEHCRSEYGPARIEVTAAGTPVFAGLPREQTVWMSHQDTVVAVGDGFRETAISYDHDGAPHRFAAIADDTRRRYGFQYHPEVDDTEYGEEMIGNFVLHVCGCRADWTMARHVGEQVEAIRAQVGSRKVFLLASGGVDSTVCARLLGRALGPDQLYLLHIDNGLMRRDESREVIAEFERHGLGRNLHFVDASDRFLAALDGVIDPELKRRRIGDAFIHVFEDEMRRLDLGDMLLAQGTIYPDTIETGGTTRADTIKTHHNRVPVIEEMIRAGRVIEPIRDLYKVEVREMAEALGVAAPLVWRHPFPGPGLGVRLLCSDGRVPAGHDPARVQPQIDAGLRGSGLEGRLLPVRSVGVKADLRTYEQPVVLIGQAPHATLLSLASQIYGRIPGVNRCVLDLSGRAVRRAEPRAATVTRARLDLLREADHIVMRAVERHGLMRAIWQFPTVMLPLALDGRGEELVILRPVLSERGMTARPAELPQALIDEIRGPILSLPGVSGLVLDLTTKPPGTIEWE
jgi:GMP synthase (glutamine-hydrolysing)